MASISAPRRQPNVPPTPRGQPAQNPPPSGTAKGSSSRISDGVNLKLEVRLLPPTLTEAEFREQLAHHYKNMDLIGSLYYVQGVLATKPYELPTYSRAYIRFAKEQYIQGFISELQGKPFYESTTSDSLIPVIEKSIINQMPESTISSKPIALSVIEKNPLYKKYLEFLNGETKSFDLAKEHYTIKKEQKAKSKASKLQKLAKQRSEKVDSKKATPEDKPLKPLKLKAKEKLFPERPKANVGEDGKPGKLKSKKRNKSNEKPQENPNENPNEKPKGKSREKSKEKSDVKEKSQTRPSKPKKVAQKDKANLEKKIVKPSKLQELPKKNPPKERDNKVKSEDTKGTEIAPNYPKRNKLNVEVKSKKDIASQNELIANSRPKAEVKSTERHKKAPKKRLPSNEPKEVKNTEGGTV
ncbi:uncharacterized protein CANTADRAFT_24264 [Suhomyces tanzawaensis NRRL Y-17324]|uniref:UPF3 domain-containing protein n=1 Tax=Suhomyces tanzawaensis NRRL Y-17324 TaxID=984487 RepID=A0A1E4SB06_9ASCO|nr:uncharacterized protein CANTADRAFT_24264 [Suhomyces tanzawaensis NRRL Y-17324]ODV76689.1 hypothetical protein CANTADRAFT_24264 [Suhomyces tanzawaensis NRRL Y-17324]